MKVAESKYCQCLYYTAAALSRKIEKLAIDAWKPLGLPPSHAYLLTMVLDNPGLQPGLLAEQLHLTPSTITRLIEKLEDLKLVVRTTEGKLTNVYPTPKAKNMLPQMKTCMQAFSQAYKEKLGEAESTELATALAKAIDKMV